MVHSSDPSQRQTQPDPQSSSSPPTGSLAPPVPSSSPQPPNIPRPDEAEQLPQQLTVDRLLRNTILVMGLGLMAFSATLDEAYFTLATFLFLLALLAINLPNARVSRQLPLINAAIEGDPRFAESLIQSAVSKRLLHPSTRLLLYAHLAQIRLRQQHFPHAAAISTHVLAQLPLHPSALLLGRLGRPDPIASSRLHMQLLLIMVESRLQCGDAWGAYLGLLALHSSHPNLAETTHILFLQTRYEMLLGHWSQALERLTRKIALAELLPTPQCGALHAFWAAAAQHTQNPWSSPLRQRAELLCDPPQLSALDCFLQACQAALNPQTTPLHRPPPPPHSSSPPPSAPLPQQ